jgi:3,4-dihydroxy 2-butanone 4-phosphate synthase / GTP cyclohydrolase II
MELNKIEDIITDIKAGKMVILMDDEDRENEGDILIAAEKITADHINFMATKGRGLICLTISEARAKQLNLNPMVKRNTEQFGTNFTVSIEAAEGTTTGISASDRATTILAAVNAEAKAADLVSPGHVFPIIAKNGGVLVRAGHTEAGCDLAKLAGLEPSCAIVEILNEDGTMARRPQLEVFAKQHDIKLGTIADLIKYRLANESIVGRVDERVINTDHGQFTLITYRDEIEQQLHYALCKGEITSDQPTLVRVHNQQIPHDLFNTHSDSWSLSDALNYLAQSDDAGVVVLIGKEQDNNAILTQLTGNDQPLKANAPRSQEIGIGSQILHDLGVKQMKLLSSTEAKYHALSGFELEAIEYIKKQ